jgi:anoctamin-8
VWATVFLEFWKRKSASLAHDWGVLGYEQYHEGNRPEYNADTSNCRRNFTIAGSIPLLTAIAAGMGYVLISVMIRRDEMANGSSNEEAGVDAGDKVNATYDVDFLITPILWGFLIPISDMFYTYIARKFAGWENWRRESVFQKILILRVFSFRFLNSFVALYYYALADLNLTRLSMSVAGFMLAGHVFRYFVTLAVPAMYQGYNLWKYRRSQEAKPRVTLAAASQKLPVIADQVGSEEEAGGRGGDNEQSEAAGAEEESKREKEGGTIEQQPLDMDVVRALSFRERRQASIRAKKAVPELSQAWKEAMCYRYDSFNDWCGMVIQFGFVCFFSMAFPIAPLCALVNNLIHMRSGAYKMCYIYKRPVARKASGIGIWISVLQFMSVMAVLTNCALIGFTSQQIQLWFPSLTPSQKIAAIFLFEHVLIGIKLLLSDLIPNVSSKLEMRIERERIELEKVATEVVAIHRNQKLTQWHQQEVQRRAKQ